MSQIADWLATLGMSEYAERFAENRIDLSVLPDLTDQDLEKLGVLLGDRRRMLRAIASLKGIETGAAAAGAPPFATRRLDTAERRQVTVLFSDLVGSTQLSARLDPEDLRDVILSYQNSVGEAVHRFEGFVAEYHGDGVLAYFGYPCAHEDDAERCVRAGLELIAAVSGLQTPTPLQTRVGIATGLVVVGDLIGSGDTKERSIVGETPNLAARLLGIAEPNTVVIADSTRKLLGNLFELQDLGSRDLKGIAKPVQAWAALRPSSVEGRFDALRMAGLSELVGRDDEFELLLQRWSKAKTGEGQVVLLSGEAGIGKSRLTAALMGTILGEPHVRLRYFCSPQHTDSPLYPLIAQLERAAELAQNDNPQARLDKLDAVLARTSTSSHDAALIAEMLSLPNDGRYPLLSLDPQQRRQRTLEAVIAQIEKLALQKPLLIIFEDVHWIDPTSLELLGRIVDRIKALPVLLIVTFRPEFKPTWPGEPHLTSLTLNRLAEHVVTAIVTGLLGKRGLPSDVIAEIVARSDGIPLFVEEMTKAVLEAESEDTARRTVAAVPSPAVAVPPSLHASLMARLDRLGAARELVQVGAAIGRNFSHALLASVARKPAAELGAALDRLIEAGLLLREGESPDATYLFKHALVQDVAYGMLLREPRRALHARIAETLENEFVAIADAQPELLAHHYAEAGLIAKAASLWGKAGQRSLAHSALIEARTQLTRALEHIMTLPGTAALRRDQINLQVALSNTLMHTKGYAAPETKAALVQARAYIEQAAAFGEPPEDPSLLFSVLYGFWVSNYVAFDGNVMLDLAANFLALAQKQQATAALMMGNRIMGNSLMLTGQIAEARPYFDRAIELYDPGEHRSMITRFGQDGRVAGLAYRAWAQWLLGYPDAACSDTEWALQDAHEIGQAATRMFALKHAIPVYIWRADYAAARALIDELAALAGQKSAALWEPSTDRGILCTVTGQPANAIRVLIAGIAAMRATGGTLWAPYHLLHLARAYLDLGQFQEASRQIAEAMARAEKAREKWCDAELHRMAGEIALLPPEANQHRASTHFARALGIAREQKAKSWELRAAISTARLWRNQGKRRQAYELLAPVYGWFTEGFDTLDLKQAKTLLNELAQ